MWKGQDLHHNQQTTYKVARAQVQIIDKKKNVKLQLTFGRDLGRQKGVSSVEQHFYLSLSCFLSFSL